MRHPPNPLVPMVAMASDAILFGLLAALMVAYVVPRDLQSFGWPLGIGAIIVGGIVGYRSALI